MHDAVHSNLGSARGRAHDVGVRYELGRTRFRPKSSFGLGGAIREITRQGFTSRDIEIALHVDAATVREATGQLKAEYK